MARLDRNFGHTESADGMSDVESKIMQVLVLDIARDVVGIALSHFLQKCSSGRLGALA